MRVKESELTPINEMISRLEKYVNMDSPSGNGECINKMNRLLQEEFEAAGCAVTRHERAGGDLLECRMGNGSKQVLLIGHMDTVFPVGTVAKRPFSITDNKMYGPGVLDMKSGVLMILDVMKYFNGRLPEDWSLCALLNADEEIGSHESRDKIMELSKQSVACFCMEPSKPGFVTVARKGLATFKIKVYGKEAHSGVNYLIGANAIQELARIICDLYKLRDDEKGISVNMGTIDGGSGGGKGKTNIVAGYAEVGGEFRCYDVELLDSLLEKLEEVCAVPSVEGTKIELEILAKRPPMKQDEASKKLLEAGQPIAAELGLEMVGRTHGGGSDGSYASYVGTPVIDGFGSEGEFSHSVDEYVKIDTLVARTMLCVELLWKIIGGEVL
ncbi:MAG: M20 family metallopeptidase [Clostridia bacterium]|nr:M20 family metallopeptidase [Clostridia bacterium]